ncbi:MAG: TonB-dependent receptor [Sphingomonadales bacterium]|uniref:TonB-dependent receptor domain-containing protein n=1 Tax=Novosphingobium sp. AAP93 TaxID=1523427 RepID=UPI0006B8D62D|nr:TonB-dependent receptor [Novosphingobium sp. AAP93]KPF81598.1 TonB-dependent receptor [Novosphingobium sp. AAP93]MBU6395933.1 TonB-dependent receptor [Sphingomonadales bacterium]
MKTNNNAALKAGAAPFALALALATAPAFAQTAAPQADAATETVEPTAIVVTGSLIRNPNLVQATPVNVTTADQIALKQSNTAEEVLRQVPGIVPNIGSAVNNGNGGSSYVDLRGLGSNRNIVLLDGQRIVPADLQGRVDLNNIPLALISRVDALTGAAVTTYGADAITGVVNFVTKKDFAGVDLAVSNQITQQGDGNYFRADVTTGVNFDDGRGNAVLSLGYQNSNPVYQGARDFSNIQLDSFSGTAGGSGTTAPARFSINGANRQINPTTGLLQRGFNPFNFNPYNIFQTPFQRFNIFAQANYQLSDAVEVYTRGLFSKNTVRTIIAPSGLFAERLTIPYSNPYLPAGAAGQFCEANGLTDAQCVAARAATDPTDPNYRTFNTVVRRRFVETGTRNSQFTTNIFDYSLGFRGALTKTVNWDVRGSYGESDRLQTITGYVLKSRVQDAVLATNPNTCISQNDGCVPINLFGPAGSITPQQAAYTLSPSTTANNTSLLQVRGLLSGDFGWTVPSASEPIGFALGAEYRKYRAVQVSDTLSKTPGELGGAGGAAPDIDGRYSVWEGYGELVVPLLSDKPFFKSLTAEGGARYSSYKVPGAAQQNKTWTYKFGGSWEPAEQLKFRANYSRAVRAPNIAELFTPNTTGLTNLARDPCAGAAPVNNADLRAVCLAQGAPANSIGQILDPTAAQANITTGGNINLKPEKARTFTVGAVIQSLPFAPGLSLSVDYYNIKVTDQIGTPLPGDLINACFGNITSASATSTACTIIRRDPATGGLDGSPATTKGLFGGLTNQGKLFTDGIDIILNYSHPIGSVKWTLNAVGNVTFHSKFKATPDGIDRECVGYYSVNCSFTGSIQPRHIWSVQNTFSFKGGIDLSFLWRHQSSAKQEPLDVGDSGPAFNGTIPDGSGALSGQKVNFGKIAAFDYLDATVRFNVEQFTFTLTVQNLFDTKPPIVGNTIGSTSYNSGNTYPSSYDALGRRFAVGARVKF